MQTVSSKKYSLIVQSVVFPEQAIDQAAEAQWMFTHVVVLTNFLHGLVHIYASVCDNTKSNSTSNFQIIVFNKQIVVKGYIYIS